MSRQPAMGLLGAWVRLIRFAEGIKLTAELAGTTSFFKKLSPPDADSSADLWQSLADKTSLVGQPFSILILLFSNAVLSQAFNDTSFPLINFSNDNFLTLKALLYPKGKKHKDYPGLADKVTSSTISGDSYKLLTFSQREIITLEEFQTKTAAARGLPFNISRPVLAPALEEERLQQLASFSANTLRRKTQIYRAYLESTLSSTINTAMKMQKNDDAHVLAVLIKLQEQLARLIHKSVISVRTPAFLGAKVQAEEIAAIQHDITGLCRTIKGYRDTLNSDNQALIELLDHMTALVLSEIRSLKDFDMQDYKDSRTVPPLTVAIASATVLSHRIHSPNHGNGGRNKFLMTLFTSKSPVAAEYPFHRKRTQPLNL